MCFPICGRFVPNERGVAGYVDRIWCKYAAKWGTQMVGMNFQTRSRCCFEFCITFPHGGRKITFYKCVIIFSYRVSQREKHSYFYAGFAFATAHKLYSNNVFKLSPHMVTTFAVFLLSFFVRMCRRAIPQRKLPRLWD